MKLLLKVCGMSHAPNIKQIAALEPDFMGFIFYPKSKRFVGEQFQINDLSPKIKRVGVFVNEAVEKVLEMAKLHRLDFVQLHGDEPLSQVKVLKKEGIGVIKVISIGATLPNEKIKEYEKDVDYFLFDTKTPNYGGSGKQFDWNLLKLFSSTVPYLLSGGIRVGDPDFIRGLQLPGLIGIDINSKFEWRPGHKHVAKVRKVKKQIG